MDIYQWLDKQVAEGRWHPDYKQIFLTITKEFRSYALSNMKEYENDWHQVTEKARLESLAKDKAVKVNQWPCPECGAGRANHKKTCSLYKGIRKSVIPGLGVMTEKRID